MTGTLLYLYDYREYILALSEIYNLKEKIALPRDLKIKQDLWCDSPCSNCGGTPCCRNLPLAPLKLNSQRDFINLILLSCYNGIYPALKDSGEWTIYLGRSCRFLNDEDGKCSIHADPLQSLVCKSYDAHNCWYTDAFSSDRFTTLIPFNTQMLIWFEKRYDLIKNRFEMDLDWDELCESAFEYRKNLSFFRQDQFEPWNAQKLSFRKSRTEEFLFFPPFKRPAMKGHFELLSFRLGFPGTSLAVSDNCWAFMVNTGLNETLMNMVRDEYYPAIEHHDCANSFEGVRKEYKPYSQSGDQWIILQRNDLELLKSLTQFDSDGRIVKHPSCSELLKALNAGGSPHRAA